MDGTTGRIDLGFPERGVSLTGFAPRVVLQGGREARAAQLELWFATNLQRPAAFTAQGYGYYCGNGNGY